MAGGDVCIWGRSAEKNADALARLKEVGAGGTYTSFLCDVSNEGEVDKRFAETLEALAGKLGLPAHRLAATLAAYNAACRRDAPYVPLKLDGLATEGVEPCKSNWAHPVDRAPFHAYPVISSNVFTYGGLKVDPSGRVVDHDGRAITGLYAAGEIVGSYYRNYAGGTSVLKGAVFGRLSGKHAAERLN